jgi:hypothetical protein
MLQECTGDWLRVSATSSVSLAFLIEAKRWVDDVGAIG